MITRISYFLQICFLLPLFFFSGYFIAEASDCVLELQSSSGKKYYLRVEVADTEVERTTGLMFRYHLPENRGMLFVFPDERKRNFWMKNTYIPLSIAYVDKKGIITEILEMKPQQTTETYHSKKPVRYAVEVNRGWFKKHDIGTGSRIIFRGCFSK